MGFIPEITCRHCGKKYSGIRKRCPHCGAVRGQTAAPAASGDAQTAGARPAARASARPAAIGNLFHSDTKWQFLFGCILIALVIIAVIVLISSSLKKPEPVEPPPPVDVTAPPTPSPTPTPTPVPTIPVTSVAIKFLNSPIAEFTQRIGADPIHLTADVYPVEAAADAKLEWRSSDDAIVTVDEEGNVTAVGSGWAEIIAECGGVAAGCKVWVP